MADFIVKYWLEALMGCMASGMAALWAAYRMQRKKQRALETGVQALLRDRIIRTSEQYLHAGDIPVYGLENIEAMYSAYHTLGGNGTMTKMVNDVRELPIRQ